MADSRRHGAIAIVGAGALGSVFAAALLRDGNDVTLLGRSPSPDISICASPCTVQETILSVETDPTSIAGAEYVLMLVKAYDTGEATRTIAPYLHPEATVVTLQNGLGNAEQIRARLSGEQRVLIGVTSQAARRVSRGLVLHTGVGPTVIGCAHGGERGAAERLAVLLDRAGLPAAVTGDIDQFVWRKVAINAAINGPTAIANVPNGALMTRVTLFDAVEILVEEAAAVAYAHGHDLSGINVALRETIAATAANHSSMLQDVEAGRRTEVEAIYGSLLAAGHARGLTLPALTVIDALVRSISGYDGNGGNRVE